MMQNFNGVDFWTAAGLFFIALWLLFRTIDKKRGRKI